MYEGMQKILKQASHVYKATAYPWSTAQTLRLLNIAILVTSNSAKSLHVSIFGSFFNETDFFYSFSTKHF